ncbi:type VII secretion protein EccE [Mycobacteroides abscessus]|uniref:type VII secretion protein EccE n=1 Tax=Mycobacteroides abscessus TaxID=36809 RepID=UPI0006978AD6|nr:type VII secretion protein EccE [Mycobacteroides abscessus]MDO3300441.1 type VII secretion protein EccE [Mycobacteroides abscessus subsp. massiliense]UEA47905.1 type VII secretion protein EccE [Mycobacteroides abscessus subsp. abscessus]UEA52114.1 type VII secretion protein EccE [Mycobacteroides abscessus]
MRSTVEIRAQRVLPLWDLVLLQVLIAVGLTIALLAGRPGWQGAAVGLVVALVLVVRGRGTTLPRLVGLRLRFLLQRRKRARKHAGPAEPFDVPASDGTLIGFRWDGRTLLSLLKIDENPQAMTVMEPGVTVSGDIVPVDALVECLRQFDITLDSIDVLSQGARSHGHTEMAAVYDAVLGPLPAIAQRTVWVAIRFDPSRCADAVRRRGGGREGILRAATTATRRVANRLTEAGLGSRVQTASEIGQAVNQLSDGVNLASVEETWRTCQEGRFKLRSFAIKPAMLTTAGLGLVWTIPSYSTTVCLSLRRGADGVTQVRGLARFDTHDRARIHLRGLNHLRGFQYSALASSLPVPQPPRQINNWAYAAVDGAVDNIAVPASGCGQVIGADEHGRAVALPLFGPQISRVEIVGTLHLAQLAVLRSLALGARVRVHSHRPRLWRGMIKEVDDHDLLWVADANRRTMQAGSDRNYTVEVFDGVVEQSVRIGVTAMVIAPPNSPVSPNADVALELLDADTDVVKVSTRAGSSVVTMVATDEEVRYIRDSFAAERGGARA